MTLHPPARWNNSPGGNHKNPAMSLKLSKNAVWVIRGCQFSFYIKNLQGDLWIFLLRFFRGFCSWFHLKSLKFQGKLFATFFQNKEFQRINLATFKFVYGVFTQHGREGIFHYDPEEFIGKNNSKSEVGRRAFETSKILCQIFTFSFLSAVNKDCEVIDCD